MSKKKLMVKYSTYKHAIMNFVNLKAVRAIPQKNFNIKYNAKNINLQLETSTRDNKLAYTIRSMSLRELCKKQGQALKYNLKSES